MQIEILSINVTDTGKYKKCEVAYKADGKVNGKTIVSFLHPDVFAKISGSKAGDKYELKTEKNDKGYWDWVAVSASGFGEASNTNKTSGAGVMVSSSNVRSSTYETADERAAKQVYIVRQSSISNALEFHKTSKAMNVKDVLETAKIFEGYVFQKNPVQELIDMEDDVPL